MLDRRFLADYKVVPDRRAFAVARTAWAAMERVTRTRIVVEGSCRAASLC